MVAQLHYLRTSTTTGILTHRFVKLFRTASVRYSQYIPVYSPSTFSLRMHLNVMYISSHEKTPCPYNAKQSARHLQLTDFQYDNALYKHCAKQHENYMPINGEFHADFLDVSCRLSRRFMPINEMTVSGALKFADNMCQHAHTCIPVY